MARKTLGEDPEGGANSCKRCQTQTATVAVRAESMCRDCFLKYVQTKVIKRMESFRVRHSAPGKQRLLLLPISFGASSLSLLHVLDEHLESQKRRTGRTGYDIHVVYVDTSAVETFPFDIQHQFQILKNHYPSRSFSTLGLDEACKLPNFESLCQISSQDTASGNNFLSRFLASLPSASSRADTVFLLRTHLLVHFAKTHDCEYIVWGSTTTRLAAQTLAETAKGRGFGLPWTVSDGPTPHGVNFHFPMRDLLKSEVVAFAELLQPSLGGVIVKDQGERRGERPVETRGVGKDTSIDELMREYFEGVEESYPSIVANVVRTVARLEAPTQQEGRRCQLCQMSMGNSDLGVAAWGGYQEKTEVNGTHSDAKQDGFCYGCARTIPPKNRYAT
ncbi:cytoplasmic tRNA 2-thiolation protein-like protein 2 [Viridothelium virens]|uniref:Cytoplasmic tRNA 2-thiolation protein 2 n=1 Tax=Viridothelium virens TaxID=1048519 RepID=A0A6A6HPF6_VIRVR|nr:cytoplasmic tRNA 2-thiolation protein-like protein 2 [Viridothelium virens]